jgi:GT2 family glycosyltransferase
MMKPEVSVIIVNYRSDEDTLECIRSIYNSKPRTSFEIVVVDNSQSSNLKDKLKSFYPKAKYIKCPGNLGYGVGNNIGVRNSAGKYILILNPDTIARRNTIDELVKILDQRSKIAAAGPNLLHENGKMFELIGTDKLTLITAIFSLTFINKIFPNNKIAKRYWLKDTPKNKEREVTSIPGSAFMIRRSVYDDVGGFDEKLFMFFEEHDLGKRVIDAGYKLLITPKAELIHKWRGENIKSEKLKTEFEKSRFYYFRKHYGLFNALSVEIFARVSKTSLLLLGILAFAAFLRFYKLEENLIFGGELGHNYLAIKNFVAERKNSTLWSSYITSLALLRTAFLLPLCTGFGSR